MSVRLALGTLAALCLPTLGWLGATSAPALAQPAYGSYVGVGGSLGVESENDGQLNLAGVVAGRYDLLKSPISFRAQAFFDRDSVAIVPTVSYDFPVSWQLEPYVGAGLALATEGSVVGDGTSFVIQPGVDYMIPNSKLVVFGNAVIAFDAYSGGEKDGDAAVSLQTGVGWRF
ncbi:MAG: porin family protein [Synechococcales cyanobacterium RU_4_20]|nr:porin family protein [Synechococcales cyanobacterium RU_4_20]NJR68232.1 porin family protein [Synechococcales cyanobacterium CRU_2_2]